MACNRLKTTKILVSFATPFLHKYNHINLPKMIQQLRTTYKGQGFTKAPQISNRNCTKQLNKLTICHYARSNRMTQQREGERGAHREERREGVAKRGEHPGE
jgi:hypothetical protein